MFCLYCGTNLSDDAIFCNKCGKQQNTVANEPVTGDTILPVSPLSEASKEDGQLPVEAASAGQETASMSDSSSGQGLAESGASPAPSASASSVPPQAASEVPQTLPPSALPNQSVPTKTTGKPTVSRRAVLIGAAGVATIATVGAGVFVFLREQHPQGWLFTYRGQSNGADSIAWAPDGKRIASGDDTVQVWDASDGGNVFTYRGHSDVVNAVAWSPDGKRIASGAYDNTVQVWDASDGSNVFTYQGHSGLHPSGGNEGKLMRQLPYIKCATGD